MQIFSFFSRNVNIRRYIIIDKNIQHKYLLHTSLTSYLPITKNLDRNNKYPKIILDTKPTYKRQH